MLFLSIDPNLKDWIQTVSWGGTAIAVVIAFAKYLSELRQNRKQRASDLRWRQADAGKKINDEMLADPEATAARCMIDYNGREFEVAPGRKEVVTEVDYLAALDPSKLDTNAKVIYVRDCFDSLFYYFATLDHYITSGLVRLDDVSYPLSYYVRILSGHRTVIEGYLDHFRLDGARGFLDRFSVWQQESSSVPRSSAEEEPLV